LEILPQRHGGKAKQILIKMRILSILFLAALTSFGQGEHPIKLGLGVVAVQDTYNESKIVAIYKDKSLSARIEDFKLYSIYGNSNPSIVSPFYYKPDYGVCYFICLEKNRGFYKILINDKEIGFLANNSDNQFQAWESLLVNKTVARVDVNANPLKEKPTENGIIIDLGSNQIVDRLEVIEVVEIKDEHWIKVYYSKSGQTDCKKGTSDCGEGWIKWRSGEKLLIDLLLLC
jgi:hypothetical protein